MTVDGMMTQAGWLLAVVDPMDHVVPHPVVEFGPLVITNHLIMLLISAAIMLIMFPVVAYRYPLVPTGFRNFVETILEFIRTAVARPVLHEHTDRFMPFLWTLFFFILINNLLGMVPLDAFSELFFGRGHLFGAATAGLSVTAGLAVVSFFVIHISGMVQQFIKKREQGHALPVAAVLGFFAYWYNLVPHVPGVVGVILFPFLFVLECIGALVKPFALAIRLFANIMAGHVVVSSLVVMIPAIHSWVSLGSAIPALLGCVALSMLDVFVAFLQAYIFTFLTCMFIGAAVSPEH